MLYSVLRIFSSSFWKGKTHSSYGAIGFSTFFHITALLIAGLYVIDQLGESQTFVIDSSLLDSLANDSGKDIVEIEVMDLIQHDKNKDEASSKLSSLNVPNFNASSQKLQTLFPNKSLLSDEGLAVVASAQILEKMLTDLSGGTGTQAGRGKGDSLGGNKNKKNGFFGTRTEGARFVFVVDRSGSMLSRHHSRWNTRYARLQYEMAKTITGMTKSQQFYIIYFNGLPTYMPGKKLVSATKENKKQYINWMARIAAQGSTDPRRALTTALKLQPDVIYFLTDGEFYPGIRNLLLKMKQKEVIINTYCFGSKASEFIMKRIARKNGGQYHFVR